jgi:O-antigen/teichoic acid export membrane protein
MNDWIAWLKRHRSSTRLAFLLQTATRIATAACALVWTRQLLAAMGVELNGLWIAFLAVATLGGLGDLGMGGAVGIRVGRLLGEADDTRLRDFLSNARSLFLMLAITMSGVFLLFSPWLPGWLGFQLVPGSGSLSLLFVVAALGVMVLIPNSYIGNVSYACANLTWPILPAFVLNQCAFGAQWLLARQGAPLWIQYTPHVTSGFALLLLTWWFVRLSHPSLAGLLPLRIRWGEWRELAGQSFWLYFWSLGSFVYTAADRILVRAGFGSAPVVIYHNNYKLCDLALFVIVAASFASMPKIGQWIASRDDGERERGIAKLVRLNRMQIVLSCAFALGYLALNDFFVRLWLSGLGDFRAPLSWQYAFALSLVITGSGDAAVQVSPRCSHRGLRVAGVAVGLTALLNLGLSILAMKAGYIWGIALATVVAQSVFSLWISRFACRELNLSWATWITRAWALPVLIVTCAFAVRLLVPLDVWWRLFLLAGIYLLLMCGAALGTGVTLAFLREELHILRSIFGSRP